jgi:cytochrome c-type biogenesis protein CcmH
MRRALILAALVLGLLSPAVAAAAAAPKADLVDLEDEVMCVTCKVPLNIAEGAQPDSERNRIRELIAAGETKAQIKHTLVAEYGPDVLALPDSGGVGITAYAIPLALGAIVIAALALLVPRWRRREPTGIVSADGPATGDGTTGPRELSDADAARLDADLARYDA